MISTLPSTLARVWGVALKKSPRSTVLFEFRRHVEDFLRHFGYEIWGRKFDLEKAVLLFNLCAGIKPKSPQAVFSPAQQVRALNYPIGKSIIKTHEN